MNELGGLSFDVSSIIAGLIFGIVGLYVFRRGRKRTNNILVLLGVALMVYPYFFEGTFTTWAVGFALSAFSYFYWWA